MPGLFACFRAAPAPSAREADSSFSSALPALAASSGSLAVTSHAAAARPDPAFVPRSVAELHPEYAHAEPYHFAAKTDSARLVLEAATGATATLRAPPPAPPVATFAGEQQQYRERLPPRAVKLVEAGSVARREVASVSAGAGLSELEYAPHPQQQLPQQTVRAPSAPRGEARAPQGGSGASERSAVGRSESATGETLAGEMAARKSSKETVGKGKAGAAGAGKKGASGEHREQRGFGWNVSREPLPILAAKENVPVNVQGDGGSSVHRRSNVVVGGSAAALAAVGAAAPAASPRPLLDAGADELDNIETGLSSPSVSRDVVEPMHTKPMALTAEDVRAASRDTPKSLKPVYPSALSGKSPKSTSYPLRKTVSFREEKPVIIDDELDEPDELTPAAPLTPAVHRSPSPRTVARSPSPVAARDYSGRRMSRSFDGPLPTAPDEPPPRGQQAMPRVSTAESVRASKKRQSMAVRDALSQQIRGVPRSAMLAYAENENSDTGRSSYEDEAASAVEPLSDGWFDDAASTSSGQSFARNTSANTSALLSLNVSGQSAVRTLDDPRRMSIVGQRTRSTKSIRLPPQVREGMVPPPPPPPPFEPSRNRMRSVRAIAPVPPPARESFHRLRAVGATEVVSFERAPGAHVYY